MPEAFIVYVQEGAVLTPEGAQHFEALEARVAELEAALQNALLGLTRARERLIATSMLCKLL